MRTILFFCLMAAFAVSCTTVKKVTDAANTQTLATLSFSGFGNAPSWSVDIQPGKNLQFFAEGMTSSLIVPAPSPYYNGDSIIYVYSNASTNLRVAILQQPCSEKLTNNVFKYSANATYNNSYYTGCASLMVNVNSIAGAWEFLSSDSLQIGQKKPSLNFDIIKNNVAGNSGCNSMAGTFKLSGNSLSFNNDFISTKMWCEGYDENKFFGLIRRVDSYQIKNNQLHLMQGSKNIMVFKRK